MYKYLAHVWQYHNSLQFFLPHIKHIRELELGGETAPHQQETDFTVA